MFEVTCCVLPKVALLTGAIRHGKSSDGPMNSEERRTKEKKKLREWKTKNGRWRIKEG